MPLARPGFLTGAVLGFAHTVGEFGVVLMIGGNIPGETKVLSVAIYDYVETLAVGARRSILAAGMVVFAFVVILAMTLIEKRVARAGRHERRRADDSGRVPRQRSGSFALDVAFDVPTARRHRAVRTVRLRQDHGPALHRRAAAPARAAFAIDGDVWQDSDAAFRPPHERPIGYVFQEASLFPHLSVRRNLLYGAPGAAKRGATLETSASTRSSSCSALAHLLDRVAAQPVRRRAPARRARPRAAVAAAAAADGRAAVGARPA